MLICFQEGWSLSISRWFNHRPICESMIKQLCFCLYLWQKDISWGTTNVSLFSTRFYLFGILGIPDEFHRIQLPAKEDDTKQHDLTFFFFLWPKAAALDLTVVGRVVGFYSWRQRRKIWQLCMRLQCWIWELFMLPKAAMQDLTIVSASFGCDAGFDSYLWGRSSAAALDLTVVLLQWHRIDSCICGQRLWRHGTQCRIWQLFIWPKATHRIWQLAAAPDLTVGRGNGFDSWLGAVFHSWPRGRIWQLFKWAKAAAPDLTFFLCGRRTWRRIWQLFMQLKAKARDLIVV